MKNNKLKRAFKAVAVTAAGIFVALFIWANWNGPTPADKLKTKIFALYNLSNVKDQSTFGVLDTKLKSTNGVLATCVKPADKIISVVFYPDIIGRDDIMSKLSGWSNVQVSLKDIVATGPTCPVAGMMGGLSALKKSLCIRN